MLVSSYDVLDIINRTFVHPTVCRREKESRVRLDPSTETNKMLTGHRNDFSRLRPPLGSPAMRAFALVPFGTFLGDPSLDEVLSERLALPLETPFEIPEVFLMIAGAWRLLG